MWSSWITFFGRLGKILGQYLARVYLEVKHRPIYIQREIEENGDGAERSEQNASSAP